VEEQGQPISNAYYQRLVAQGPCSASPALSLVVIEVGVEDRRTPGRPRYHKSHGRVFRTDENRADLYVPLDTGYEPVLRAQVDTPSPADIAGTRTTCWKRY
jgi:hypothetical protein